MKIKIYGERNTGTKFLRDLLKHNGQAEMWPGTYLELAGSAPALPPAAAGLPEDKRHLLREACIDDLFAANDHLSLGWKHCAPGSAAFDAPADTRFVVIVKHPLAWAISMFHRPFHNPLSRSFESIDAFVRLPWLTVRRDNLPSMLSGVTELWNLKYESYSKLRDVRPTLILRYEDLILRPDTLGELAAFVGGEQRVWTMPDRVRGHDRSLEQYREFYRAESWRDALGTDCAQFLRQNLDADLANRYGYRL